MTVDSRLDFYSETMDSITVDYVVMLTNAIIA